MQQILMGILLILGIACWWLYSENQTLTMNNMQLEVAIKQQEEATATIKESYEKLGLKNSNKFLLTKNIFDLNMEFEYH